jgi:septal ring factor EnvC (AmiA/AmiB activator)
MGTYGLPGTVLKNVSDGITISLPVGSTVKSVADGEVSVVYDLEGEQAVMVRHGKYLTVYSHLSSASVSRGQKVRAGTVVGRAAANEEGEGEVSFMITNEKGTPLNPESWLRKK